MSATARSPSISTSSPGSSIISNSPAKARSRPSLELVALDRGEEPDRAEVDAEHRDAGAGEVAQGVKDRAVAAEDEAEVGLARAAASTSSMPSAAAAVLARALRAWRPAATRRARPRPRPPEPPRRRAVGMRTWVMTRARRARLGSSLALTATDEGLAVALRARQPGRGAAPDAQAELACRGGDRASIASRRVRGRRGRRRPCRPRRGRARTAA